MTVAEAAKFLFVSQTHIRKLLASGKLVEVLPRAPGAELDIDVASVEAHREKMEAGYWAYQTSRTEDDGPIGF
jgi:hypothetical protein